MTEEQDKIFIDCIIVLLENIKKNLKYEAENGYFNLFIIGEKITRYGVNISKLEEKSKLKEKLKKSL